MDICIYIFPLSLYQIEDCKKEKKTDKKYIHLMENICSKNIHTTTNMLVGWQHCMMGHGILPEDLKLFSELPKVHG